MSSGFVGLAVSVLLCGADDAKQNGRRQGADIRGARVLEVEPSDRSDAPWRELKVAADRRR